MGKSNKNKNAQNEPRPKTTIEEPDFGVKLDSQALTAGEKKLLAQKERDRKAQEEEDRMRKEKLEAEKKKKNNKASSSKTKTKQGPPKTKEEEKQPAHEAPNPKTTRTENEGNEARFQEPPKPRSRWSENVENAARFQETPKSKTTRDEHEANNWSQDSTSNVTSSVSDSAWDWKGTDNNWRNEKKRGVGKPNYSDSKKNANDQNNFAGRSNQYYTFSDGKNDKEFQKFLSDRSNFNGKVREEIGDLFTAPGDYSLAHCVAEDFSMGAGIAKEFRARFKRVSKLLDQNAKTGGLAILEDNDRFIYYLVTKAFSRGKPTLYTLWKSLLKLQDHITEHKVNKLAIPQIGCGLDRLDWFEVKRMLEYVFSKNDIDIVVYILEFNAEETPNPAKPAARKSYVVHKVQPLTDIQAETGLIFFGAEDGAVTHEMECLAKKLDFINEYKTMRKSVGDTIKIVERNEYLYGLIVKRTSNNKIVFADFEKCLYSLKKQLKTDQTVYIGLQGFVEKDDEVITDKLVNLMQNTLPDVEIWVCWPEKLAHLCPQQKKY